MINRQGGESRGIDHTIDISGIRKKSIQTTPKNTAGLGGLLKVKNKTHFGYV